jgi:acyl-coenzyme A synthetase/AMP-(fatty) acid ligase/acyl carrier protein
LLKGCSAEALSRLEAIDHWVLSGEALPGDLVNRLRRVAPEATVLNLYGSTEVAGDVTVHECGARESGMVPAGTAIDGMRVRVVDHWGRDAPCGAVGEVTVEGPGLATGYLGDPRMTADRFRPAPGGEGTRAFRTGDLGRHRVDGVLEICGRADRQLKVNGVRVEPAEIETAMASHPLVAACGVVALPLRDDASLGLVAFVELSIPNGEVDARSLAQELRDFLRGRLPSAMVPGRVVIEVALPRTGSGKIDRSKLAAREALEVAGTIEHAPPATPAERVVAAVWADELGVASVGIEDDFFELGGDSLTAVRVLAQLARRLDVKLTLRDLFDNPTVRDIACRVELAGHEGALRPSPDAQCDDQEIPHGI